MLKPHADKMLQECGIVDILRQHGEVLFHGSYATDLMVWPDIDVNIFNDDYEKDDIWKLIGDLSKVLPPQTVFFANQFDYQMFFNPKNALLVEYLFYHEEIRWKLDLVVRRNADKEEIESLLKHDIDSLDEQKRNTIMQLKGILLQIRRYRMGRWKRDSYSQMVQGYEVTKAVTDYGVTNIYEFAQFIQDRRGIDLSKELAIPPGNFTITV